MLPQWQLGDKHVCNGLLWCSCAWRRSGVWRGRLPGGLLMPPSQFWQPAQRWCADVDGPGLRCASLMAGVAATFARID